MTDKHEHADLSEAMQCPECQSFTPKTQRALGYIRPKVPSTEITDSFDAGVEAAAKFIEEQDHHNSVPHWQKRLAVLIRTLKSIPGAPHASGVAPQSPKWEWCRHATSGKISGIMDFSRENPYVAVVREPGDEQAYLDISDGDAATLLALAALGEKK